MQSQRLLGSFSIARLLHRALENKQLHANTGSNKDKQLQIILFYLHLINSANDLKHTHTCMCAHSLSLFSDQTLHIFPFLFLVFLMQNGKMLEKLTCKCCLLFSCCHDLFLTASSCLCCSFKSSAVRSLALLSMQNLKKHYSSFSGPDLYSPIQCMPSNPYALKAVFRSKKTFFCLSAGYRHSLQVTSLSSKSF